MDRLELDERFTHHPPTHEGIAQAQRDLRHAARMMARVVEELCPDGREKALAMTKLEEAMFWGDAAIARKQVVGGPTKEQRMQSKRERMQGDGE